MVHSAHPKSTHPNSTNLSGWERVVQLFGDEVHITNQPRLGLIDGGQIEGAGEIWIGLPGADAPS